MVDYKDRVLHIIFDTDDSKESYKDWKSNCLKKFGFGGIKSRIIDLISKDLKTLRELNKDD